MQYNLTWCADFDNQEVIFEINVLNPKRLEDDRWLMIGFSDHGKEAGSDFCLFNNNGDKKIVVSFILLDAFINCCF